MSENEKQLPSSPETKELGIEKTETEPDKGIDCLNPHENIKKIQNDVRQEIKDVDYWNEKKEEILVKNGFPKHALKATKIMAVLEVDENGVDDPELCLMYNETGKFEDMLGYEPFQDEKSFEEVSKKIAGYYKEVQENRIKVLDHHIAELRDQIKEHLGREWTYEPQECDGTYIFEEGKGRQTSGVMETFQREEIKLFVASLRKRLYEQKLLPENLEKEAVGLDYLQFHTSNDGKKVYLIDQLDQNMKDSEKFLEEYNYWTILLPEEN